MGCVLWPWLVTLALAAGILEAGGGEHLDLVFEVGNV